MAAINLLDKELAIAVLNGDIETVKERVISNGNKPVGIIKCDSSYRGDSGRNETLTTLDLSNACYDAFRYSEPEMFEKRNVEEMYRMQLELCGTDTALDYSRISILLGNSFDHYNDNPRYDENETKELIKKGATIEDVEMTNFGTQHIEKPMIELLQDGASPYFVDPERIHYHENNKDAEYMFYLYDTIAPLLSTMRSRFDYTISEVKDFLDEEAEEDNEYYLDDLADTIEGIITCGACQRILNDVEENITPEARQKGIEMMEKYLCKVYPISFQ